jgi:hypothetical protein
LVLGQDQGFSEDPTNVAEELTETPNQSSESSNTLAPNPTQEGKPRTYPTTLFILQSMSIYLYLCIKSRSCNETLDTWILGTQCIVPESLSDRCSANRTGRSRVISCHSHDIEIEWLLFAITVRIMDGVMYRDMTWKVAPSVLIKVDKAAVCGSGD